MSMIIFFPKLAADIVSSYIFLTALNLVEVVGQGSTVDAAKIKYILNQEGFESNISYKSIKQKRFAWVCCKKLLNDAGHVRGFA